MLFEWRSDGCCRTEEADGYLAEVGALRQDLAARFVVDARPLSTRDLANTVAASEGVLKTWKGYRSAHAGSAVRRRGDGQVPGGIAAGTIFGRRCGRRDARSAGCAGAKRGRKQG